jgi:hypothetical protein
MTIWRRSNDQRLPKIIRQALDAAREHKDPYKTVAVAAWPVRALIERKLVRNLSAILSSLLEEAKQIEHPVSRLDAFFVLWQAEFPFAHDATQALLGEFVSTCQAANSWKAGDRVEQAILIIASQNRNAEWLGRCRKANIVVGS